MTTLITPFAAGSTLTVMVANFMRRLAAVASAGVNDTRKHRFVRVSAMRSKSP